MWLCWLCVRAHKMLSKFTRKIVSFMCACVECDWIAAFMDVLCVFVRQLHAISLFAVESYYPLLLRLLVNCHAVKPVLILPDRIKKITKTISILHAGCRFDFLDTFPNAPNDKKYESLATN